MSDNARLRRLARHLPGILAMVAALAASGCQRGCDDVEPPAGPAINKSFTPPGIGPGATTTLTFEISNESATPPTFTDHLADGMVVANPPMVTRSDLCDSTAVVTATPGSNTISLSGGTAPPVAPTEVPPCIITVQVTASQANTYTNSVQLDGGSNTSKATLTVQQGLPITNPLSMSKSFNPSTIPLNTASMMTITITNSTNVDQTGVNFVDIPPTGLALGPVTSNTCGGQAVITSGGQAVHLSDGVVPAMSTCTITLVATGTTTGRYTNTTKPVSSIQGGVGNIATGILNVTAGSVLPLTISKSFSPSNILFSGVGSYTSTLTITITNPTNVQQTGASFVDDLPAGLTYGAVGTNSCGANISSPTKLSLSGGVVPPNGTCAITVPVTGTTAGQFQNTIGGISSNEGGSTLNGTSASLNVTLPPLMISKSFSPSTIPLNGTTVLTFTITNPAGVAQTAMSFLDNLPTGLGPVTVQSNTCNAATHVGIGISAGAGTVPANGSCTISVTVIGTMVGTFTNTTSVVSSKEGGTGNSATAVLTVTASAPPLQISKSFSPSTIPVNGTSTLTITITNPASIAQTGVTFSDFLPAGLSFGTASSSTCTFGTLNLTATSVVPASGTIPANSSCTIAIGVTGTTAGTYTNTTTAITSTEGGPGNTATAMLTVTPPPPPPLQISKVFNPSTIPVNGTSTLTFTITNPASVAQNGVGFTDVLPTGSGLTFGAIGSNTCSGVAATSPSGMSVGLAGGTIAANSSCTITVSVTGTTPGTYTNTTGAISSTQGGMGNTASAMLTVTVPPPLQISKAFSPSTISAGATSTLTFTITNPASVAQTGVGFTDLLPTGSGLTFGLLGTNSCSGSVGTLSFNTAIALAGGTVAANSSCTITVSVTGTTPGTYTNTTGPISSTQGGSGNTGTATLTVTAATTNALQISKQLSPNKINPGGTSNDPITITNSSAVQQTGVAFTDTLTGGVQVATSPMVTNNCGGTLTATPGATSFTLSGGTVAANSSCTIFVQITGTQVGNNIVLTAGPVSSNEGGVGNTAMASLSVANPPTVSLGYGAASIPEGGTISLTITVSNPAGNTFPLSGVNGGITLPANANVVVASPNGVTNTCGGTVTATPGSGNISLSGITLAQNGQCMVRANVTAMYFGVTSTIASLFISDQSGFAPNSAPANLNVVAPPGLFEQFQGGFPLHGNTTIQVNGAAQLNFTVANPNTANSLSQLAFTDNLPAGIVVASPNGVTNPTCGGTVNASGSTITLAGGTLAANGQCNFTVNVTGTIAGTLTNTPGAVSSLEGGTSPTASAQLFVVAPLTITKAFNPTAISFNGNSQLTFTITNPAANTVDQPGTQFADTFPTNNGSPAIEFASLVSNTCGGSLTATAGTGFISLSSVDLAVSSSCTLVVSVTGVQAGTWTNTTDPVSSLLTTGAASNTATLTVNPPTGPFTIGGTVINLAGTGGGLQLQDNLADTLLVNGNGSFTFPTALAIGSKYSVTVSAEPTSPPQTCSVTQGTGTATTANVTNVLVDCGHNEWTWASGANVSNQKGMYVTQGTPNPGNFPGARASGYTWNNFWLFGGSGYDSAGTFGPLNDLWQYSAGEWTWVGGSNVVNQNGSYGTQGMAVAGNIPGARSGGVTWTDEAGNLWLFGGFGKDSAGTSGYLNDLWEYSAGLWTWVSGSKLANQQGRYATPGNNVPGARIGAVSWLDEAGNFWLLGGNGYDSAGTFGYLNDLWEYSAGQWTWMGGSNLVNKEGMYGTMGIAVSGNVPGARQGAVSWVDLGGNFWLLGGQGYDSAGTFGYLNDLWLYTAGRWAWMGGSSLVNQKGMYVTQGTADAGNTPGARSGGQAWTDAAGNFWLLGGFAFDSAGTAHYINDLWEYSAGAWTWVGGSNVVNQKGTYGTEGTPGLGNIPGARESGVTFTDGAGNLWLFGGTGYDSGGALGSLNDLWLYEP